MWKKRKRWKEVEGRKEEFVKIVVDVKEIGRDRSKRCEKKASLRVLAGEWRIGKGWKEMEGEK